MFKLKRIFEAQRNIRVPTLAQLSEQFQFHLLEGNALRFLQN